MRDSTRLIVPRPAARASPSLTAAAPFTQAYKYDRWGNRTVDLGQSSNVPGSQYDFERGELAGTNRLLAPGDLAHAGADNQNRRMRYDAAGNLTHDGHTGNGSRTYDAENRMTGAVINQYGDWALYTYDADGRRVRRQTPSEEWWQVYGAGGELVAEYRAGAAAFLPSKEYGYRGGELLVTMSSGDDQRLRRFVYNLYYGALQRDPTAQELEEKTNQLAAAGVQGQAQLLAKAKEVARALFLQTNYETSPSRSDVQYVHDLYYTYMQRAPDDAGLAAWVAYAAGGAGNRANACTTMEGSSEFAAVVSTLHEVAGAEERTDRFIHLFYLAATGAIAPPSELQQRRAQLDAAAAGGPEAVKAAAESMGRQVFASQVSDLSVPAQQLVTNLYEGFLQRGPDAQGLAHWAGAAGTTAQSRQNVLDAFAVCGPFRELAGALYRETFWLVSDHLGTPRMIADRTGSLAGVKRHDYLPFGEELYAEMGGRTPTQGYGAVDNVRQKFTAYERDSETNLDYAQARYYSSTQGRFISADPALTSAERGQPQSWNRYTYCLNNPQFYVDPTGLVWAYTQLDNGLTRFVWYATEADVPTDGKWTIHDSAYYSVGDCPTCSVWLDPEGKSSKYISHQDYQKGVFGEIADNINAYFAEMRRRSAESDYNYWTSGLGWLLLESSSSSSGTGDPIADERRAADQHQQRVLRLRHYTSTSGKRGIQSSNRIVASDQDSVFADLARGRPYSPRDAESRFGIRRGRGNAYVEFNVLDSEVSIVNNPLTKVREFKFKGDVDLTDRAPTFHFNR